MARVGRSSSGGSVNIQDSNGSPILSTGGALNVTTQSAGTAISEYNEVTGVAMGSNATVISYTVPMGGTLSLSSVQLSGDSIGFAVVNLTGITNAKQYISYTNYNLVFEFNSLALAAGTIITAVVNNQSQEGSGTFNATIQGVLT